MGYDYKTQRPQVFTEDVQVMFLKIRDNAKRLIKDAGVVTAEKLMKGVTGDTWTMLACMDRLIEIGELREIPNILSQAGQHRIFTSFEWS
jgi:hypothetical protein